MYKKAGIFLVWLYMLVFLCCQGKTEAPILKGEYLGQEPPGKQAVLFSPGVMSTGMRELNAVFFPGGKEVIYSVGVGEMKWAMLMIKEVEGAWTKPQIAPFSGEHGGVDPFVSFDGRRVYFCSNRPRNAGEETREDYDIWYVDRTETGWSDPVNMGAPVNSDTHEFYPSFTRDGTMYVQSRREGGIGQSDIYRLELEDGRYVRPVCLPEPVNSPGFEGDAFIAPDESYIIVSTYRAEKNIGRSSDLYISFRSEEGTWTDLINMGENVNATGGENCQILSPCGKYLFFTSRRYRDRKTALFMTYDEILTAWTEPQNGFGDIYWVDARIIEDLRQKHFEKQQ
jgi:Tol biopolymer transport system component